MAIFNYVAIGPNGNEVRDTMEAADANAVITNLMQSNLTPLRVSAPEVGLKKDIELPFLQKGPSGMDIAMFTRQLATLMKRGVPITRSLNTLARQATNPGFQKIIMQMLKDVGTGLPLVDTMRSHPKAFDEIYIGIAAAGEESGNLDKSLTYLADMKLKDVELTRKIRSSLTYPSVVLVVALGITYFLMTTIVPQFAGMLTDVGGKLPPITIAVIFVSDILRKSPLLILGTMVIGFFALKRYNSTPLGKMTLDGLKLKAPIFGNLILKSSMARITRSMGMMLQSGMPMLTMLSLTEKVAGNAVIAEAVREISQDVKAGTNLSGALMRQEHIFPPMLTSMVATGDETGAIDEMLAEIAVFYDMEVEEITTSMASLIEPIMTIFLGLIVGIIVASLLLPYFSIISNLQG